MSEMPEQIWAGRVDGYGQWWEGPDIVGRTPYTRADIAAAQVAAAYERAADRACERLADSWTWDDADFLACVIADLKRHLAALATDTQADALEQVRREADRAITPSDPGKSGGVSERIGR